MSEAVVTLFKTASCPICRRVEETLTARDIRFRAYDVSADRSALVLLLRYAGRPIVPTIVAYGEVMVGFDEARLEQVLERLAERADVYIRRNAEEEEQIRQVEVAQDAADEGAEDDGEP